MTKRELSTFEGLVINNRYEIHQTLEETNNSYHFLAYDTLRSQEAFLRLNFLPWPDDELVWKQLNLYYTHTFKWLEKLSHPGLHIVYDCDRVLLSKESQPFSLRQKKYAHYFASEKNEGVEIFQPPETLEEFIPPLLELLKLISLLHNKGVFHYRLAPSTFTYDHNTQRLGLLETGVVPPGHSFFPSSCYTAPEVVHGLEHDARCDIYSLLCAIFEMRGGKFAENRPVVDKFAGEKSLKKIFQRGLAALAHERYYHVEELALELELCVKKSAVAREPARFYLKSGFIDSQNHLKRIETALESFQAKEEVPFLYWITGKNGEGKSKLVAHVATLCNSKGIPYVASRITAKTLFPLAPFVQMLTKLSRENFLLGEVAALQAPLVPEMPLQERYLQTRESVIQELIQVAKTSPLVLLVDDLELASPLFLDFFYYLFLTLLEENQQERVPLLIISSYTQESANKTFTEFLEACNQQQELSKQEVTLQLASWNEQEVGQAIAQSLNIGYNPEIFAARLAKLTSGNPLQIQQILTDMMERASLYREDEDWCIEASALEKEAQAEELASSFRQCWESLNPICQQILEVLAFSQVSLPASTLFTTLEIPGEQIVPAFWFLQVTGFVSFSPFFTVTINSQTLRHLIRHQTQLSEQTQLSLARALENLTGKESYPFLAQCYLHLQQNDKGFSYLEKTRDQLLQLGIWQHSPPLEKHYFEVVKEREEYHERVLAAELRLYASQRQQAQQQFSELHQQQPQEPLPLLRLAEIALLEKALKNAQNYRNQAKEILSQQKNSLLYAIYYGLSGEIRYHQHELQSALNYVEKGLQFLDKHIPKLEDKHQAMILYHQLLTKKWFWEHYVSRQNMVQRGLEISQRYNQIGMSARFMLCLAQLQAIHCKYPEALKSFQQSLALFEQLKTPPAIVNSKLELAGLLLTIGSHNKANNLIKSGCQEAKRNNLTLLLGKAYLLKSWLALLNQRLSLAKQWHKKSWEIAKQLDCLEGKCWNLLLAGNIYLQIDIQEAKRIAQDLTDKAEQLGYPHLIIQSYLLRARIQNSQEHHPEEVISFLQESINQSQTWGFKEALWQLYYQRGCAFRISGDIQAAVKDFRFAQDIIEISAEGLAEEDKQNFFQTADVKSLRNFLNLLTTEFSMASSSDDIPFSHSQQDDELDRVISDYQEELDSSHFNALREENTKLKKLLEINRKLLSERDLRKLLELIMDTAIEQTHAERGFVILLSTSDHKKAFEVARNFEKEKITNPEVEISHSIAEKVIRTGIPILASDAIEDDRFDGFRSVNELKLHSVLAVPLKSQKQVIGAVYIDNRFQKAVFSRKERQFLEAFATQATLAIENTRLLNENFRKQEEIQTLNEELAEANAKLAKKVEHQKKELREVKDILKQGKTELEEKYRQHHIIGNSASMREIYRMLEKISSRNISVLIHGESGTGKELVARAIHFNSNRCDHSFMSENCAALPDSLLANELFGHVKGAYTGADQDKKGLFEMADKGTLFLDEVGDMSPTMQANLLRVLETNKIRRVGGKKEIQVDVRIISASNKDLKKMVAESEFREDLFFRLKVVQINLPPLRERKEDIPLLVEHFIAKFVEENKTGSRAIDKSAMQVLRSYSWPGNVRELRNVIYNALSIYDAPTLTASHFKELQESPSPPVSSSSNLFDQKLSIEEYTRQFVLFYQSELNDSQISKLLGISRKTLWEKRKKWGILKND